MVVTRFAPSPTGYLHIGGARTALFNWLFARRHGGSFILRIEDTDQKRNTSAAIRQVIADLRWLGIDWDQGPEIGGDTGPYLQSQRLEIYNEYLAKLIASGSAYYCFDTTEELAAMRTEAEARKSALIYRPPEKPPDEKDVANARAEGKPVTVRMAVPADETIVVSDEVRGQVSFEGAQLSDFVIQKSDGFPTYHFACVVDDELMGVTHVIRGQEHLMNTPGHIVLQKALGFKTPVYAHMSVTVSEGGGKLSKRERPKTLKKAIKAADGIDIEQIARAGGISAEELESFLKGKSTPEMDSIEAMAEFVGVQLPEINVVDFFKSGYLPETMLNFMALLGWNPGDDREIMQTGELIESFDLSRLTKTNSLFDRKKLIAFNTEHIRLLDKDKLLAHFKAYLEVIDSAVLSADDKTLGKLIEINAGARTLADIERKSRFLFAADDAIEYDPKAVKKVLLKADALSILAEVREKLAAMDEFTEQGIENMLRSLAEQKNVGLGKVAQPLRVAICGSTVSPPIFNSVDMLGRESTLARIDMTLKKFTEERSR